MTAVLESVMFNPNYGIAYPDSTIINTFNTINATTLNAYSDEDGVAQNLVMGATSNVNIEALEGVNIYFDESNALTIFNTSTSNDVRTDTAIFTLQKDASTTSIIAPSLSLSLAGGDTYSTTKISAVTFQDSNATQLMNTTALNGFLIGQPTHLLSNLNVNEDVVSHNNIACSGNLFSSTLNLYKNINDSNDGSNAQVAYAFYINEHDQLDLIKYNKYNNSNTVTSIAKRIATFGKLENTASNITGDLNNYTAINEFNGIVGQSNGLTSGLTTVLWSSTAGGSNIYYDNGLVGVGFISPTERLHVNGNVKINGNVLPQSNLSFNMGSADLKYANVYTDTLDFGGGIITMDKSSGAVLVEGSDLVQINMTSLVSKANSTSNALYNPSNIQIKSQVSLSYYGTVDIYTSNNNLGIGTSDPLYPLHISGTVYSEGFFTSLSDQRYKTNIEPLTQSLDKVCKLNGYKYTRTDFAKLRESENAKHIGFIAQEVKEVVPELVEYDSHADVYSIKYMEAVALLSESIKELREEVKALQQQITK